MNKACRIINTIPPKMEIVEFINDSAMQSYLGDCWKVYKGNLNPGFYQLIMNHWESTIYDYEKTAYESRTLYRYKVREILKRFN